MTESTLSQQVDQWKTRLNTITNNLMDLYGAESTKVIRARLNDPANGFSGVTKAKAARAVEMLDDLVDLYNRLARVVDEASDLVRRGGVLRNNEERVKELLDGPSIVMHTQHIVVSVNADSKLSGIAGKTDRAPVSSLRAFGVRVLR